ncbi:MAG: hypothetical protein GXY67_12720 [Clostridiales bacterium]|nr:hypothetical protein [Clostridiales bacterium]
MNQMNGTFTLAFVEEDNKQRVIFRVAPLSTREGVTFRDVADIFPDEGSLRVVPDKREQSTFKERMRSMGCFCVINLVGGEGKELVKVRQNKNYDPAQGETNQLAIYSDVIQEFTRGGVFEVLPWMEGGIVCDTDALLTREVLILCNKVLYGPVIPEHLASANLSDLKPFGNDRFLLHTVDLPYHGVRMVYWNPEETFSWRQKRGSLHRKAHKGASEGILEESCPADTAAEDYSVEIAVDLTGGLPRAARSALSGGVPPSISREEKPSIPLVPPEAAEEALPIGEKLSILAPDVTFEEHLSRLDQPLSEQANRLSAKVAAVKLDDNRDTTVRFLGTPLEREIHQAPKTISRPEPLHRVVEQQLRNSGDERVSAELKGVQLFPTDNPVENLLRAVEETWQDRETRSQAISALIENQGFVDSLMDALRQKGKDLSMLAAAYAQLEELEVERFRILVQLNTAKTEQSKYREELLAAASQKKREEIEALNGEIQNLSKRRKDLEETLRELSIQGQGLAQKTITQQMTGFGGIAQDRVLISPVIGHHHKIQEMVRSVHGRMNARGFLMSEDDALSLLIVFAQFPVFCLEAACLSNAQFFATTLLEALSLQSVSSTLHTNAIVEVASLLPEDERRTPTVTLQLADTQTLSLYGHKTIYLSSRSRAKAAANRGIPYPVMKVPPLVARAPVPDAALPALSGPAALSSFSELNVAAAPLLSEFEEWLEQFKRQLSQADVDIPETTLTCMRWFISVAAQTHRGGLLDAADRAVCQWVVPELIMCGASAEVLGEALKSLPRSMEAVLCMGQNIGAIH